MYDCVNNNFPVDGVIPALKLSLITIDDIYLPRKICQYTSDPFPAAIYVTSGNYVITLNNPYEPKNNFLNYDDSYTQHTIMIDNP